MMKWSQLCEDTGCGGVPKSWCTGSQQSSFQRDFLRTILMVQFAVLCWLCVCFLGPSPLQDQCRSSHFPSLPCKSLCPCKSLHLTSLPAFLFSDCSFPGLSPHRLPGSSVPFCADCVLLPMLPCEEQPSTPEHGWGLGWCWLCNSNLPSTFIA